MMKERTRTAIVLFAVQTALYGIICINFRAVAHLDYGVALATDFLVASMNFFVISKIAKYGEDRTLWVSYVFGSLVGTALGMFASTLLTHPAQ